MPSLHVSNNWPDEIVRSMSTNRRYLRNDQNAPLFLVGSSHQGMMFVPTSEMIECLASRKADGVNSIITHVLLWGAYGDTSQNTYDSINPFTTSNDISTPNESYFARLDAMLNLMWAYQMNVFLVPYPTKDDWMGVLRTNGSTKAYNFGAYLGARYKKWGNLIWTHGNDFQTWETQSDNDLIRQIHDGIASEASQWQTMWENYYHSDSLQDPDWQDSKPNLVYSYHPQYDQQLTAYARTVGGSPVPAVFFEGHYEDESYITYTGPKMLRTQEWWSFLSGACGSFYGQNEQFRMCTDGSQSPTPDWNAAGWDTSTEWLEFLVFVNFVKSKEWWNLIPDETNTILTAGYGTYASYSASDTAGRDQTNDYATCAALADGSLAVIYMPTNRTMTVDMSFFSGTVTCRWFDPTDGSYTADAASPCVNSGTHNFSRAATNSAGAADWVLVLEA